MRVVIALGGNAMTSADGSARPEDQIAAIRRAGASIAAVVAAGAEVVLTHGNGPQVGNLLVKNEMAAHVVPPVTLDWCGAQTQGTVGFVLLNELQARLPDQPVAALVTRALVDAHDPGFVNPSKPIGRYLSGAEAAVMIQHGQLWEDRGERGWRRIVASPEPRAVLDAPAVRTLLDAGYVVVCNGGGGVPVVREPDGRLRGVEAVIDKDLGAALLAHALDADVLVIATDVEAAVVGWGTPQARALGEVGVAELRRLATEGHFASGSMGPKVEAACRFAENGGRSVITSLDFIADAVQKTVGTVVTKEI
ncbi:carbamate kinase [Cryptosporangium aurantiacum]|uniref:Carbamate kinase n=1 Tax=Cryptosporangium aurantiacum TaxID=134849 RepID=A0A1M7N5C7_9ACTN|nr:carbamate kinase [Cryptosporangium aurantiacum]SHM98692.1 carbamate kinase [Cryptosporangium aurantiacum]